MIKHLKEINSTSKYMMEHPDEFNNLDILSASHQNAGIGRTGHQWFDEEGDNILFSIMIKDKEIIDSYKLLSISMGVILAKHLEQYFSNDVVSLKWPNDVYVNEKKICGILLQGKLPDYVVIGVGVNINQQIFKNIDYPATSLSLELGKKLDIINERKLLFEYVIKQLTIFDKIKRSSIADFNKRNYLQNKDIAYFDRGSNSPQKGVALTINDEGELLVKNGDKVIAVSSSEITKIR